MNSWVSKKAKFPGPIFYWLDEHGAKDYFIRHWSLINNLDNWYLFEDGRSGLYTRKIRIY